MINTIERRLGHGTFRNTRDFIRRVAAIISAKGQHNNDNANVTVIRATNRDASMDGRQYRDGNQSGTNNGQSTGNNADNQIEDRDGSGLTTSTAEDWNRDADFFITPQGEVYGFAAPNGELYFDETVISPNHPLHEYTHLWDRALAKNNPELWKRGIELMKNSKLTLANGKTIWQDVEEDLNYG